MNLSEEAEEVIAIVTASEGGIKTKSFLDEFKEHYRKDLDLKGWA